MKILIQSAALLGLILSFAPASLMADDLTPCYGRTAFERLRKRVTLEIAPGVPGLRMCDKENAQYKLYSALTLIESLTAPNEEADDFDTFILSREPWDYVYLETGTFKLESASEEVCRDRAYIVGAGDSAFRQVQVCPSIVNFSALGAAENLLHMIRHAQGHKHESCKRGLNKGAGGCDKSYLEKGANAVSAEFFVKVARDYGVSGAIEREARSSATTYFLSRFNELPLDLEDGIGLLRDDGDFVHYAGRTPRVIFESLPRESQLTAVSSTPFFIRSATCRVLMFEYDRNPKSVEDRLSERQLCSAFQLDENEEIRDFIEIPGMMCALLSESVHCRKSAGELKAHIIPVENARGFLYSRSSAFLGSLAFSIVDSSGDVVPLPLTWDEFSTIQELKAGERKIDLISIAEWSDSKEIAVRLNGDVVIFDRKSNSWSDAPALSGFKAKRLIAPFVWSPKIHEL